MKFRDRILILIFLVVDMVALNLSILIISYLHYDVVPLLPNYVILIELRLVLYFPAIHQ